MIEYRNVSARYPRQPRDVLHDVSLVARAGVVTAVVGPNGSGKSSLVRLALRQLAPGKGEIRIVDRPLSSRSGHELATQLAVVSQREEPAFPLPVAEYVALGRFPHRPPWGGMTPRDQDAVQSAMAIVDVEDLAQRTTDSLSGGEWQRVRLARAIAQDTRALLFDEPTTFMDVAHEMAAFELMATLARQGKTVLLVSHQMNLVARFADHVVLLNEGQVVASGAPDVVMQSATLESVYRWPLVVTRDPAVGAPTLVPLRRSRSVG